MKLNCAKACKNETKINQAVMKNVFLSVITGILGIISLFV